MKSRIDDLETKLNTYSIKFNNLNKRRNLDIEGFISDASLFKKKTKDIEDKVRKRNLGVEEKDDILADVQKLKNEIKHFQNQINQGELEEA